MAGPEELDKTPPLEIRTVLSNMTAAISTSGRFVFAAVTRGNTEPFI